MIKILFVSADPSDAGRLRVEAEFREIKESLHLGRFADRFKIEYSPATRPKDFIQAMLDFEPDIVHFSGHGSKKGELWLENDAGKASPASPRALAPMFEHFSKKTHCIILNACYTQTQAKVIAPHVYHLVGTTRAIHDDAAIGFSTGFYKGLANGCDIPNAYRLGCANMWLTRSESIGATKLTKGSGGAPLDFRFPSHLPIIVGMGCSKNEFRGMTRDALHAMQQYGFSEELYRDRNLTGDDYLIYEPEWILADTERWNQLAQQARALVDGLNERIAGPKIFHFFLRVPICFAIGFGAMLGTRYEAVLHHYQPSSGGSCYSAVIDVSVPVAGDQGAHLVRAPAKGKMKYISVAGLDRAKGKVYVSVALARHEPAAKARAKEDRAQLVEIGSGFDGNIPLTLDWLTLARELNTALLALLGGGKCAELHLFPAAPIPIAFAMGMGLDTRSPVVVHQWYATDSTYHEVFRLNQLGPPARQ